jgi:pimeloyl-ACP methyl ester carboxylesterase
MLKETNDTIVVLLPGLWMPAWVMALLQRKLERAGFGCKRFGYRSARAGLEENSARLAAFVRAMGPGRVHLVGHSLGGVLALHATATHGLRAVHRIVMLGSPWRDSYAARKLGRFALGRWMIGRTVPQWLACSKPSPPSGVEVGVIAGTMSAGLGMVIAPGMPKPHDGVIRVEETALTGMSAHTEAHVSHAGMLWSQRVGRLVTHFLMHGRFELAADSPSLLPTDKNYAFGRRREP